MVFGRDYSIVLAAKNFELYWTQENCKPLL